MTEIVAAHRRPRCCPSAATNHTDNSQRRGKPDVLSIRKRITYTNVAVTFALVFAMTGGAYAAGKFIITSTKQIKPSVLAQLKGKAGPQGAAGAPGAAGSQGPVGPAGPTGPAGQGEKGEKGEAGSDGKAGANGENVTVKQLAGGQGGCAEGGSEFTNKTGKATACNGSPWVAGGVLPSGKSESGEWALSTYGAGLGIHHAAVSFPLPLGKAPSAHYINTNLMEDTETGEQKSTVCLGSVEKPEAKPGNVCVYASLENGISEVEAENKHYLHWKWGILLVNGSGNPQVADPFGFDIAALTVAEGAVESYGSWAVTAE